MALQMPRNKKIEDGPLGAFAALGRAVFGGVSDITRSSDGKVKVVRTPNVADTLASVNPKKIAIDVAQGTARTPETVFRSAILEPLVGNAGRDARSAISTASDKNTGIRGFLYGDDPVKSYQEQARDIEMGARESANKAIRSAAGAAPFVAPALAALDVFPGRSRATKDIAEEAFGSAEKEIARNAARESLPTPRTGDTKVDNALDVIKNASDQMKRPEVKPPVATQLDLPEVAPIANQPNLPRPTTRLPEVAPQPDIVQEALRKAQVDVPTLPEVRMRQEANEMIQAAQVPRVEPRQAPLLQAQSNNLPVGDALQEASMAGQEARRMADEYVKSQIPRRQKVVDFIDNQFTDDTGFARRLDREAAKRGGEKVRNVSAIDSLDSAIQAYRASQSVAEQRYKDFGITDFADRLSDQKTYDAYRIYRTFRTNVERAEMNRKPGEDVAKAYARFTGGRNLQTDARLAKGLDDTRPDVGRLFQEEVEINRNILRANADDPNLLLTPEQADDLIAKYPNYTPQSRETSEDLVEFARGGRIGSQQGPNIQKLKEGSTTRQLEDPLVSLMENADRLVKKGMANRVSNILVKNHGAKLRPLVTEADLIAKENAKIEMSDLGKLGKTFEQQLKKDTRWAKELKKSIELASQANETGKVTLKQKPGQVTAKLANMTDRQYGRLRDNLARQGGEYDEIVAEMDNIRAMVDDIKSAKAGIMNSGALDAFEKNAGKNVLRRVVNGREEIYEIMDARLAQNMANMSGKEVSQAAQTLGVPVRTMKFFTTGPGNVLGFAPIAITRDVLGTLLFAKAPIRAIFDPRSWADAFKVGAMKGELFEELSRRGITGTMVEGSRASKHMTSDAIRNQGANRLKVHLKNPKQALRDIENVEMATERFSRGRVAAARYRQQLAKYSNDPSLTPDQAKDMALWDAADEYREAMINFSRGGKTTRELNQLTAYLNPAVQAGNLTRKRIRESPGGFAARAGVATSLLAGAYAYSHASPQQQEIYNEMSDEDKRTNLILVGPDAKMNPTTGEITGVVKIPLPQEFAPFTDAVNGIFEGAGAEEYGQIALSGLSALTGLNTQSANALIGQLMPTTAKPIVENATNHSFYTGEELTPEYLVEESGGDKTKQSKSSTSGTGKAISKAVNGAINPIEADNLMRGILGGASKDILAASDTALNAVGIVPKEDVTSSDPLTRLRKRYTSAYGKTDGVKYFDQVRSITDGIKDADDKRAFELLHAKDATPGLLDTPEKAVTLLNRPDVFKAEKKLNDWNKKQGKAGNPLFDLPEDQRTVVLALQANRGLNPGDDAMPDVIEKQNPWLTDYYAKQSDFFDQVTAEAAKNKEERKKNGLPVVEGKDSTDADKSILGITKPEYSDSLGQKFRAAGALTDAATKAKYYKDNPELTEYLTQTEEYNRAKRAYLGLPQLDKFPGSPEGKALEEQYFSLDKAGRKAFIKANPQLSEYWLEKNLWQMNEAAARNRYEGEGLDAEEAKDIMSVARTLGGGGGGGNGRSSSSNPLKYAVSIDAGGEIAKPKVTSKKRPKSLNPKGYAARKSSVGKPKVTIKKSEV